jgi:general secretion pathway protein F
MATFRYRAATASGQLRAGTLEGSSREDALARIRALGLRPIEAVQAADANAKPKRARPNAATRQAVANIFSELAVLLGAGLPLDRALRVCTENTANPAVRTEFERLGLRVKEGVPLSTAMADSTGLLPPLASAMAEAGEAGGTLDVSLAKLGDMLERGEALRQTIVSAMVYPIILLMIAGTVILVMLLWIVPQFESLFTSGADKLPPMTSAVIGVSHAVKDYGLYFLLLLVIAIAAVMQLLRRPAIRFWFDRRVLSLLFFGTIVRDAETARFCRTLGSLVDSGVPLPSALMISGRTLTNRYMASAIEKVATGLKEGGGLSRPLAEAKIFPPIAMSFLRTGEETARLAVMLNRLSDVLDRNVRTSIDRAVSILTPAITVLMGMIVATVIASIMSAILGFNDLAMGT